MKKGKSALASIFLVLVVVAGMNPLVRAQSPSERMLRANFAPRFQTKLLAMGIHAQVRVEGKENNILFVESRGLTPEKVFSVVTSRAVSDEAKALGFKEIVFSTGAIEASRGRGQEWDYSIERESMIWLPSPPVRSKGSMESITPLPVLSRAYRNASLDAERGLSL
jgi:hypothetical protein